MKRSACIDALYGEIPFLDRFQAAKDDGFDAVEFWGWPEKDLNAVKEAAEKAGIPICGFNGDADLSLIDPDQTEAYMEYLEKSCETAKFLNAPCVTIHSNGLGDGGIVINHYDNLSNTVKTCTMFRNLEKCAALAEKTGIQMNLEGLNITTDHVGNFLRYTQDAAEMIRLIGSPKLKVLYNAYHMQINEGCICDTIKNYDDTFGHVHIADAPGRHEPGTGEIYYPRVYKALEEVGYDAYVGYELFPATTTAEAVKAIMTLV
jgi:hydroxypyruvate isomerase